LNDAEFFFREDRKRPLPDRLPDLRQVIFQEKLGSVAVKVERIQRLAAWIAERVDPATRATAERAALLCKADLTTNMVKEFPNLQGVMGREYARLSGEPPEVCQAIEEHYLPRFTGDRLPASVAGAAVALADRLDSIVGCFGVGLVPTGSEDPYALRRAALGVVQTVLQWGFRLSLDEVVAAAQAGYGGGSAAETETVRRDVLEFLRGRTQAILLERGLPRTWWSRCSPPGPATSPTPSDGPRRWRSCGARRISASWPRPSAGWWGSSRPDSSGRWRPAGWWRGPSVPSTPRQRS
jgi:glycyl-tRNA synthetase beta chain